MNDVYRHLIKMFISDKFSGYTAVAAIGPVFGTQKAGTLEVAETKSTPNISFFQQFPITLRILVPGDLLTF